MWNCSGRFDPVRGTQLEGRIRNAIEALFHDAAPDDAPTDPIARQEHLAALALLALSEGKGTSGLPDVTVLIDEKTLVDGRRHEHSAIDAGLGRFGLQHGSTDVDNLVPLCSRHHHLVHEGGWQLVLEPDRTLTVIRPGGHITTTGPPSIRAA
jgi:hypothetical protein